MESVCEGPLANPSKTSKRMRAAALCEQLETAFLKAVLSSTLIAYVPAAESPLKGKVMLLPAATSTPKSLPNVHVTWSSSVKLLPTK